MKLSWEEGKYYRVEVKDTMTDEEDIDIVKAIKEDNQYKYKVLGSTGNRDGWEVQEIITYDHLRSEVQSMEEITEEEAIRDAMLAGGNNGGSSEQID